MVLVCDCQHERRVHESGKEKLMDGSVSNCMEKECNCKSYHPNHATRQIIWELRFKSMLWSGLILVGCIIAGIVGYYAIEFSVGGILDQYTFTENYKIVHQFANGTTTHQTGYNYDPKDELTGAATFPLFFILLILGVIGSFTAYSSSMENRYRKLVRGWE